MKILILCTGNTCRSQMAEGIIKSFDQNLEVFSGGTKPEKQVNPRAIKAMKEVGIDISTNKPEDVNKFINQSFDYVITVCDNAKETCPVFMGDVKQRVHMGFNDPASATGTEEEIMIAFRKIRDRIKERFFKFYVDKIK